MELQKNIKSLSASDIDSEMRRYFQKPDSILDSNSPVRDGAGGNDFSVISSTRLTSHQDDNDAEWNSKAPAGMEDVAAVGKKLDFEQSSWRGLLSWFNTPKSIKNRNTNKTDISDSVLSKRHLVGKIMSKDKSCYRGLASGILLEKNIFLCTRHSLRLKPLDQLFVGFGIYADYNEKPKQENIFGIKRILEEEYLRYYEAHGIHWVDDGDLY